MRYYAIATILVCACATTGVEKLPEGWAKDDVVHPEFKKIRPTALAVMRVRATNTRVAVGLRRAMYDRLFKKNYSCLRLASVDKHTGVEGVLDPKGLAWDATFAIEITKWKSYRGGRYYAASGTVRMVHRHGETLWQRSFGDYLLEADVKAGGVDIGPAVARLAAMIDETLPKHPDAPPPE